jgi:hypothetical protein
MLKGGTIAMRESHKKNFISNTPHSEKRVPIRNMQDHYSSKVVKTISENVEQEDPSSHIKVKDTNKHGIDEIEELVDSQVERDEETSKEKGTLENIQLNKHVRFDQLTLEEKLSHLKRVPATVAKIRYQFFIPGKSFAGYFLSLKNGILSILLTHNRKILKIEKEKIIDVKKLGL